MKIFFLASLILTANLGHAQNCQEAESKIQALKAEIAFLKGSKKIESLPKYVCSVACSNGRNDPLLNHPETGTGATREEALNKAKQTLLDDVNCTYGIIDMGCEVINSQVASHSCSATCVEADGAKDIRSLITMKARTLVEAKVSALKSLVKKFPCTYGEKVICK